jgi:hypothetical protein
MNKLKRPDLSDWPEWLRDGPVWGRFSFDGEQWHEGPVIWYATGHTRPYVCVSKNGIGVLYSAYAEPIYQWVPEPDDPVLWWRDDWANYSSPGVNSYQDLPKRTNYLICKPEIFTPWTVGECRRRLAAGELEEYKP